MLPKAKYLRVDMRSCLSQSGCLHHKGLPFAAPLDIIGTVGCCSSQIWRLSFPCAQIHFPSNAFKIAWKMILPENGKPAVACVVFLLPFVEKGIPLVSFAAPGCIHLYSLLSSIGSIMFSLWNRDLVALVKEKT